MKDDTNYPLEIEKSNELKHLLLLLLLWVVIFGGFILYHYASGADRVLDFKKQCVALDIKLDDCREIWKNNHHLNGP